MSTEVRLPEGYVSRAAKFQTGKELRSLPSVYRKKLKNLITEGPLVTISSADTVSSALDKLAYFNISSCPVILAEEERQGFTGMSSTLGFVDMLDLLAYLVKVATKKLEIVKEDETKSSDALTSDDMELLKKRSHEFKVRSVTNIIDLSHRNPFVVLHQDMTLKDALDLFLKGIHRIAVVDDQNSVIGIVSQWTIADYLAWNVAGVLELSRLLEPINTSPFKTSRVCSVHKNTPAIEAFMFMHQKNLSAIAVVDDNERLFANLSASDLEGLRQKNFDVLLMPVDQFLAEVAQQRGRAPNYLAVVSELAMMLEVIFLIKEEGVHRVYIIDNDRKPLGVISLTDVMRALTPENAMGEVPRK